MTTYISYRRVSSSQQGASGLGLDAQLATIQTFTGTQGWMCLGDYTDVASGTDNNRPGLSFALRAARETGSKLVVATTSRISRRLSYTAALLEREDVELVVCDLGLSCDSFTMSLMAAFAAKERELISKRTKAALAQAKLRGVKLGSPDQAKLSSQGNAAIKQNADDFARKLAPIVKHIREVGRLASLSDIAACLNARGITTRRGKAWTKMSVCRLEKRITAIQSRSKAA